MNRNPLAGAELEMLLGHPALAGRWPDGFTGDDVLADLMALGRISIKVRDDVPYAGDDIPPRFACRLELREDAPGAISGNGHSLTAAGLRCLIEAESDLAAEVERGLGALGELLGDG